MPDGPGVRVDAGMEADTDLRPEYDPLLAKILVHADDRAAAIARLRRALDETRIGGLQTDAGFLRWVVDDEAFAAGDYDTGFIGERWRNGPPLTDEERSLAAAAAAMARASSTSAGRIATPPAASAWAMAARRDGLRG
jgi:acetyl/propionyl-CoA carboxylase alpha subunit